MQASDIMTRAVISVQPDTELHAVVDLLLKHRISGAPVVERGEVLGFVGHGDLLHRHEIGTDAAPDARTWWQRLMGTSDSSQAYIRSHSRRVRDVMNPDVVQVEESTPVTRIAAIFEARHVRRIAVVRDGCLVGLVTRYDLMRALARASSPAAPAAEPIDDEQIRLRLLRELDGQPWWSDAWSSVFVHAGIVYFAGVARCRADQDAARVAAENLPGVRAVRDQRQVGIESQPIFL